jgi:hypothetical protein
MSPTKHCFFFLFIGFLTGSFFHPFNAIVSDFDNGEGRPNDRGVYLHGLRKGLTDSIDLPTIPVKRGKVNAPAAQQQCSHARTVAGTLQDFGPDRKAAIAVGGSEKSRTISKSKIASSPKHRNLQDDSRWVLNCKAARHSGVAPDGFSEWAFNRCNKCWQYSPPGFCGGDSLENDECIVIRSRSSSEGRNGGECLWTQLHDLTFVMHDNASVGKGSGNFAVGSDHDIVKVFANDDARSNALNGAKTKHKKPPRYMRIHRAHMGWQWSDDAGYQITQLTNADIDVSADGEHWFHLLGECRNGLRPYFAK